MCFGDVMKIRRKTGLELDARMPTDYWYLQMFLGEGDPEKVYSIHGRRSGGSQNRTLQKIDNFEERASKEPPWQRNCSSVADLSEKVLGAITKDRPTEW